LQAVCGNDSKPAWEQYAQNAFAARAHVIPHNDTEPKLRFLQYVTTASDAWWSGQVSNGAVLLKPTAKRPKKAAASVVPPVATGTATAATTPLIPTLKHEDPKRVAAAHEAWKTIRDKKAAAAAGAVVTPQSAETARSKTRGRGASLSPFYFCHNKSVVIPKVKNRQ